ncbi:CLUMA_CG015439, isoform A [Clunio marinus]|uniref:CLUMA_CG015439, isoform A n=1 Tax=Clunio marinus TaxID=568069 RepID=A0A1J1IR52_9DIPT|nr:CLUMA_CG015439, isoform A [Clunio marinus]
MYSEQMELNESQAQSIVLDKDLSPCVKSLTQRRRGEVESTVVYVPMIIAFCACIFIIIENICTWAIHR